MMRLIWAAGVAVLAVACGSGAPQSSNEAAPPVAAGATISGRISFSGPVPPAEEIRLDADPQCEAQARGARMVSEALSVGGSSGLKHVFIYIKQGLPKGSYPAAQERVVLDQQRCQYMPRVVGVQAGQTLVIRNSDPLLHTVRADAVVNAAFNLATPVQHIEMKRSFAETEVMIPIKCDMHPWMRAWVGVMDHPFFAVSDSDGRYAIRGLPKGRYVIETWHERLGRQSREVEMATDGIVETNFAYTPVPSRP